MLKLFFRFVYLPVRDALVRAKQAIAVAKERAEFERDLADKERRILRDFRLRHMTPEQRAEYCGAAQR
jgi:hypothetical protein